MSLITLRAKLSGAVYCNRSCLSGRAGGGVRTLLQPARAQCLRLSERFFILQNAIAFYRTRTLFFSDNVRKVRVYVIMPPPHRAEALSDAFV